MVPVAHGDILRVDLGQISLTESGFCHHWDCFGHPAVVDLAEKAPKRLVVDLGDGIWLDVGFGGYHACPA